MRVLVLVRAAVILALCSISLAHAQSPADFYKGKTIDLYIGYSAGGGYDVYARALARHMTRFVLVEGLHRLEACKQLGEETILGYLVQARRH